VHERSQVRLLFLYRDRDTNYFSFQQLEDGICVPAFARQEKSRLRQDWLACE